LHELSIASGIIQSVKEAVSAYDGVIGVKEIEIRIGSASFVGREQLGFCVEVLTEEDPLLKGVSLKYIDEEVEIHCPSCGRTGPIEVSEDPAFHYALPIFACPECGSSVEITKGRSISITNVILMMEGDA